jgi:small-conductance mechanosensitive channel
MVFMNFATTINNFVETFFDLLGINLSSIIIQIITAICILFCFLFFGWVVYTIFERYFTRWAEKTKTNLDDEILKNIKKPIYFVVLLIGVYTALNVLTFLVDFKLIIGYIFIISEILLATFIITRVVNVVIAWYSEKQKKRGVSEHILFVLKRIINGIIFLFAFLIILYVFRIDLSGIVVGLGVGGIAIAFALQNVLSDAFSAFSIYFDKPFEIGDFIIIGDNAGTVKKIGMKSTRIQLLQGEELVVANSVLTTTNVRNFKKMQKRRIAFTFGVTYSTPVAKLRKIPDMVKSIIEKSNLTKVERIHFKEFGDFSLNYEVVYYLNSRDYAKFMDVQQEINLSIKEAFEKEGIEMAFPTQTIYLNKNNEHT